MVNLTTAYPIYALEADKFDVVDYLLETFAFNRFSKLSKKTERCICLTEPLPKKLTFFIKFEGKYEKIRADEILYIRSQQNYVILYAKIGKYITLMSLKTLD